jgi:hypothetical protein
MQMANTRFSNNPIIQSIELNSVYHCGRNNKNIAVELKKLNSQGNGEHSEQK